MVFIFLFILFLCKLLIFIINSEWSGNFMSEVQKRIGDKTINQNMEIDQNTMYGLIKHLHSHIGSSNVNKQFQLAIKNVVQQQKQYTKKKLK